MLPSSVCRRWQPDQAANAAQDARSYTTPGGTIQRSGEATLVAILPPTSSRLVIEGTANGSKLVGSGFSYLPKLDLDARVTTLDGRISGWVSSGWLPSSPIEICFEDVGGNRFRVATEIDPASPLRRRFEIDPAMAGFVGGQINISAAVPGYGVEPLPDSPLLLEQEVTPSVLRGVEQWAGWMPVSKPLDCSMVVRGVYVVVPVYLGREESLACIQSLLASCGELISIVVVDDASPDKELSAALDRLAAAGSVTLLRNERNLGFPGAIKRGIAQHPDRDVVILNSDTSVHGNWLARLQASAYRAANIGTVTPLTNHGSIASYPLDGESDCTAAEAGELDRLAAIVNEGITIEVPVGVGFCLYLRRDCLDEIGLFDAATFARGYGEETDLCMRARGRGWRNVLAPDVFVQHLGGRSFGTRQNALLARSQRLMNLRYPGYDAMIQEFIGADPVARARRNIDEIRLAAKAPIVLLVTNALKGGVLRFVRERASDLREQGFVPIILQPKERDCVLSAEDGVFGDLRYRMPEEFISLRALLERLSIEHVELHHFLDVDGRVIDAVMGLRAPCDIYVHDYIWLCPRITMMTGTGQYCHEPPVRECERCIKANGSKFPDTISVKNLRVRSEEWLRVARAVIAPSSDVAARLVRYFPEVEPRTEPWEQDRVGKLSWAPPAELVRVALIGAISENKGYNVLLACAKDAAARDLPLEFVVVGYTEDDDPLLETGKVFITGPYEEAEIDTLLRRERPHLAFFPSVWPETWCYSLTPALRAGLEIVAFDLGAVAERLRALRWGILFPLNVEVSALNAKFLQIGEKGDCAVPEKILGR